MHGSKEVFEPDHFTHSFAMQYIALILFILIFSIAAFLNRSYKAPHPVPEKAVVKQKPAVLAEISLDGVFTGTSVKEEEGIPGIISLLKAHDVDAQIKIFWGNSIGLPTALKRGQFLMQKIAKEEIPAANVQLLIEKNSSAKQGEITISRSQP